VTKAETNGRQSFRKLQMNLAEYLIQARPGQQLPSIRQLAADHHASIGAVSTALNDLEATGAVRIQKRGHLGSQIAELSVARLWTIVEQKPLVFALTLPMHSRFEGLATGIKMTLDRAGIEAYLIFIRGSRTRLKALRDDRCHIAIMSGLAAKELTGQGEEPLLSLPPGSWLSSYSVFYRPRPDTDRPLRVAIDDESYDHRRLTELEFAGQPVEMRRASYVQVARLLRNQEVDATIWTVDQGEEYAGPDILNRPLSEHVRRQVGDASISATLVGQAHNHALRTLLQTVIDPQEVLRIQSDVVAGKMIPEY